MTRQPFRRRPAFTLFQLLVVLALLLLLFALFFPAVIKVRSAAARSQCSNNLHQIGIAMHNSNDTIGKMPPALGSYPAPAAGYGSVFFHFLPYIEQDNLYKNAGETVAGQMAYNVWVNKTYRQRIKTYECPQDTSQPAGQLFQGWLATSSYAANAQVFGTTDGQNNVTALEGAARIPASFPDGTSNTIAFTERYQRCGEDACAWGYWGDYSWTPVFAYTSGYNRAKFQVTPRAGDCNPALAQTAHPAGILVGLGDASVRVVSGSISQQTWWAACTPAGGEVLGSDW